MKQAPCIIKFFIFILLITSFNSVENSVLPVPVNEKAGFFFTARDGSKIFIMDYLRCFAITFGVCDTAGVIMLIFGVMLILCWLAALFLENFIFLTVGFLFSALYCFMQILFYELPRKVKMSTIAHTLPAIFMFFPGGTSHCQANEVNKMSPGIDSRFVFPLTLSEEPLNRLRVASFKDDPEYEGIEPQMFDDNITGKGLKILMYRKDKNVDVYWQPGVHFDINTFKIGEGIGHAAETVMSPSRFDISENGVEIRERFPKSSYIATE